MSQKDKEIIEYQVVDLITREVLGTYKDINDAIYSRETYNIYMQDSLAAKLVEISK